MRASNNKRRSSRGALRPWQQMRFCGFVDRGANDFLWTRIASHGPRDPTETQMHRVQELQLGRLPHARMCMRTASPFSLPPPHHHARHLRAPSSAACARAHAAAASLPSGGGSRRVRCTRTAGRSGGAASFGGRGGGVATRLTWPGWAGAGRQCGWVRGVHGGGARTVGGGVGVWERMGGQCAGA